MSKAPIGIFDSGVGGTSIFKEVHALMPNENIIYLADSANAPYGSRDKDAIISLSVKNTEYLLSRNCKLIIVACNTATTNAIRHLRANYNVPFIGIEPAIKPAALNTKTQAVGILATKGTLSSQLFSKTATQFASNIKIIEQIGEGIVELIESGNLNSKEMKLLLQQFLAPMIKANIDYLVLGCTHYPYLVPILVDLLPKHIKIIDSGQAVARQTQAVLSQQNCLNNQLIKGSTQFFTNGGVDVMLSLLGNKFEAKFLEF